MPDDEKKDVVDEFTKQTHSVTHFTIQTEIPLKEFLDETLNNETEKFEADPAMSIRNIVERMRRNLSNSDRSLPQSLTGDLLYAVKTLDVQTMNPNTSVILSNKN